MKRFFLVLMLTMLGACSGTAYGSICAECDAYKYQAVVPYVTGSDGWWAGFAVTNTDWEPALLRMDFVGEDGKVIRKDINPKGVTVYSVDLDGANYVVLRSDKQLTVTVITSNGVACIDSVVILEALAEPE